MTERHKHHPQNFGVGHAFFLLFHPRNSKLKNRTASWAGEFFDRIAFNDNLQILLNECLSYSHVSPRFPQKQKPKKKKISYSTTTPNSKKKKFFRINIITNISKPRIKSSVNGFRQISQYEQEKKIPNVAFKLKLKKFHFTSQNNITITVQKCSVFFSSFFNLCTVYLKKMFVLSFFFFFFFHMLCSTIFKFLLLFFLSVFFLLSCTFLFLFSSFFFLFLFSFFFIINCSFNVPFFSTLYLPLCLYLNTITKGSPPSLFNFSLQYHKLSLIYNKTFSIAYEHSSSSFFFLFTKYPGLFSKQPKLL